MRLLRHMQIFLLNQAPSGEQPERARQYDAFNRRVVESDGVGETSTLVGVILAASALVAIVAWLAAIVVASTSEWKRKNRVESAQDK